MIYWHIKELIRNSDLINAFIEGQMWLILVLSFYTAILLKVRLFLKKEYDRLEEIYSEQIITFLYVDPKAEIKAPKKKEIIKRVALKRAILAHISRLEGTERDQLVHMYNDLGFVNEDLKRTYSWRWNVRLVAVTNLNAVRLPQCGARMFELLKDSNDLVAATALLTLSGTAHPKNVPHLFQDYGIRFIKRNNLLIEIAKNIPNFHGIGKLYLKLEKDFPPQLKDALIGAIITSKDDTKNEKLVRLLSSKTLSVWAVRSIIESLSMSINQDHKHIIKEFLFYPNHSVRVEAKKWFVALKETFNLPDAV